MTHKNKLIGGHKEYVKRTINRDNSRTYNRGCVLMSRYPNRIPSRPSRPVQENKPSESASDLFKDVWDVWAKNEKQRTNTTTCEDYIRNLSVKNRDYTIPTYRNTTNNTFSTIVRNEDIKEIKLIGDYNIVDFPISNNRVEFFYTPTGKRVDYKEITKTEKIEPSECREEPTNQLKKIGFNEFYQLYKLNEFGLEIKLCQMAIIRG